MFSKRISKDITKQIISCAIDVHSSLGSGLLENVYEEALAHEFNLRGIEYERQELINLNFNVLRLKDRIKRLII